MIESFETVTVHLVTPRVQCVSALGYQSHMYDGKRNVSCVEGEVLSRWRGRVGTGKTRMYLGRSFWRKWGIWAINTWNIDIKVQYSTALWNTFILKNIELQITSQGKYMKIQARFTTFARHMIWFHAAIYLKMANIWFCSTSIYAKN